MHQCKTRPADPDRRASSQSGAHAMPGQWSNGGNPEGGGGGGGGGTWTGFDLRLFP